MKGNYFEIDLLVQKLWQRKVGGCQKVGLFKRVEVVEKGLF